MRVNRNPGIVLDEIQQAREELAKLAGDYASKRDQLSAAEVARDKELSKSYLRLIDEVKNAGGRFEKLPAEDMRKVIAHDEMDERVWASFIMLEGEVEGLDKLLKAKQAQLSSLQSELKWLESEYRATSGTDERTPPTAAPLGPLY